MNLYLVIRSLFIILGRGSGSFAGGTMMSQFGARLAFRVMGIAAGVMFIVYGAVYYGYLRRRERKIRKKEAEQNEVELRSSNIVSNCSIVPNASTESKLFLFPWKIQQYIFQHFNCVTNFRSSGYFPLVFYIF